MKLAKVSAKNKSLILSVLAGIGTIVTGVLAARGAKKVDDEASTKEKVLAYAPAMVSGGATIACIAASNYISREEVAAVTAGAVALGKRFADYKKSVEDNVSEEQLEKIDEEFYRKEIDRLEKELAKRPEPVDENLLTFIDSFTGYTFRADLADVKKGIQKAVQSFNENESLAWCDIFYFLNNEDTIPYHTLLGSGSAFDYGYGWSKAMIEEVYEDGSEKFGIYLSKYSQNTYFIEYGVAPEFAYEEY